MAELAPIHDCVDRLAGCPGAIDILKEVYQRRPAIMVGEVLDKLRLLEHGKRKELVRREPRSLKNHPLNPGLR